MMSVLENATRKVTDTMKAAAKKSGELLEITKLSINISNEEGKIVKAYTDIGKLVYESFTKGEEVSEEMKAHCEAITSFEESIKEMRQKILEIKNLKLCPSCGKEVEDSEDIVFCYKCGTKL